MGRSLPEKVLVAMSGGVDSSVAAALLKEQGYGVVGVTMKLWDEGRETRDEGRFGGCCSIDAVDDAKKVCAKLGIPHYTLNFQKAFRDKIIDDFIFEYKNGRTPNPCIRCNRFMKFDLLAQKARELDCQFVATGHYAKIVAGRQSPAASHYKLLKGADKQKDQSYVLYMMDQESLARTLFPLGGMVKRDVRKLAGKLKLPVHDKAESQEICFVQDDDYGGFLREFCPEAVRPGEIVDLQGGVVGRHEGIAFYTLGQRKGIGHHQGRPKYVVRIDQAKNQVVIGDDEDTLARELNADQVTYIAGRPPDGPLNITAKIRYNSRETEAVLYPGKEKDEEKDKDKAKVVFAEPQRAITPGQSVVFYQGEEVIGGGIIS